VNSVSGSSLGRIVPLMEGSGALPVACFEELPQSLR